MADFSWCQLRHLCFGVVVRTFCKVLPSSKNGHPQQFCHDWRLSAHKKTHLDGAHVVAVRWLPTERLRQTRGPSPDGQKHQAAMSVIEITGTFIHKVVFKSYFFMSSKMSEHGCLKNCLRSARRTFGARLYEIRRLGEGVSQ